MTDTTRQLTTAEFLERTLSCIRSVFDPVLEAIGEAEQKKVKAIRDCLQPGKMLRTRLALALLPKPPADLDPIIRVCAATELIHTATLFHDDVIDGASLRRGQPPLWEQVGATGAILMGDLFFSAALDMLLQSDDLYHGRSFVRKVREVCTTEASHELVLRGKMVDVATSIRIARGKTGALFAFAAEACGDTPEKRAALEEAGYLVGTAYQLADDLIDEAGDERVVGKTLGTDRKRRKYTLMQAPGATEQGVLQQIQALCEQAVAQLHEWPELAQSLTTYINDFLSAPKKLHFAKVS